MKRIDINIKKPNFIGCWNIEDQELCNEIINFFDDNDVCMYVMYTFTYYQ